MIYVVFSILTMKFEKDCAFQRHFISTFIINKDKMIFFYLFGSADNSSDDEVLR